jgi:GNAT superfamily N-acetyltransferase
VRKTKRRPSLIKIVVLYGGTKSNKPRINKNVCVTSNISCRKKPVFDNIVKMTIERANIGDSAVLTEITKRSKAYWGYSDEQIAAWAEALTITIHYIETKFVYKLVINSKTVGYYSFFNKDKQTIELDNLFILPEYIGNGLGRILMNDFLDRVKKTGASKIILDSEPNVERFYTRFGFIKIGESETSIKNRYLPKMEMEL